MKIKTAIAVVLLTVFPIGGRASDKSPLPTATPEQAKLIDAIVQVESKGKADAVGDDGEAIGILQIHTVLVDDVNRILGSTKYSYDDRFDKTKSYQMFIVYTNHYTPSWDPEKVSRRWVSGPKGDLKKCSIPYWHKVRKVLALIPKIARGKAFVRQGEWFLVPVKTTEVPEVPKCIVTCADPDWTTDDPDGSHNWSGFALPVTDNDSSRHLIASDDIRVAKDGTVYAESPVLHHSRSQHREVKVTGWVRFACNTAVRAVSVQGVD